MNFKKFTRLLCLTALLILNVELLLGQNGVVKVNQFGEGVENTIIKVVATNDGGYIALGRIRYGSHEYLLLKYDAALNEVWKKYVDENVNDHIGDEIYDVIQTSDGGYITCGNAVSAAHGNSTDVWLKKFSSSGAFVWDRLIGGTSEDIGHSIQPLPNNEFLILASTSSTDGDVSPRTGLDNDTWIVKLDGSGTILVNKLFGGSNYEFNGVITEVSADGSFAFAVSSQSNDGDVPGNHGSSDIWICKLNSAYQIVWSKSFGGSVTERISDFCKVKGKGYAFVTFKVLR
jgi:hypothetical protein